MAETILIVAAHPDDEILGVGGTAARHAQQGDAVHSVIVAEGVTSRSLHRDVAASSAHLDTLGGEAARAAAALGLPAPRQLGLPDNRLDSMDLLDVIKPIEAVVSELRPHVIYTHHAGDLNIDHEIVHRAVLTAARRLPGSPVRAIYTFETLSSTEWGSSELGAGFRPSRFVDVSATLSAKLKALEQYEMEMRPFPHARSLRAVEAQARLRGAQSGMEAAEAFGVIYELWPRS
jgi:LmbE family N-acetylglucosaminyl deacetylase